jgi:tRNA (mo5U34)-methyltransferase
MLNIQDEISKVNWWHPIDLDGYVTPGMNIETSDTFLNLPIPNDLTGKTVLDIGCWDGYYSFACESRGAERVVASDYYIWTQDNKISGDDLKWTGDAGFDLAHKVLKSKVEKLVCPVEDLNPDVHGKFDYVLMLGVIYHAKNPFDYIERAAAMSKDILIIETHIDMLDYPKPAARFYSRNELNNDSSNYWGPNPAAVVGMMREIGMTNVQQTTLRTGRMIFSGQV